MKSSFKEAFSPKITSRQRKRSEDSAIKFFKERTSLSEYQQVPFIKQIRGVKQPIREARRIVAEEASSKDARLIGLRPQSFRLGEEPHGRSGANVWFEQINEITWKLTDGVMTEQEGRLDTPTTRALAWIAGFGWTKDGRRPTPPSEWTAFCGKYHHGPTTLRKAKQAALAMLTGRPVEREEIEFTTRETPAYAS
jgi:hypothetical protein